MVTTGRELWKPGGHYDRRTLVHLLLKAKRTHPRRFAAVWDGLTREERIIIRARIGYYQEHGHIWTLAELARLFSGRWSPSLVSYYQRRAMEKITRVIAA